VVVARRFFDYDALSMDSVNCRDIFSSILLSIWLGRVLLHQVLTRVSL
jgi:hypothetical protein